MTAVIRRAELRRSASSVTSSSISVSFAGYEVGCTTKTSSPRTFSWISTNTSMSAKRRMEAPVSGSFNVAATASARGRLLLQATIFMLFCCQVGSSDRFYAGLAAFYQRLLRLSMNGLARLPAGLAGDHVVHPPGRLGRDHDGNVGPVAGERARGNVVELHDLAAFVAARDLHGPLNFDPLLAPGDRHQLHVALHDEVGAVGRILYHRPERREMRPHLLGQRRIAVAGRSGDRRHLH